MKIPRRKFIVDGASLVLTCGHLLSTEQERYSDGANKNILVVVQLVGGNDGLNTVVPFGSGHYFDARPNLAVRQEDVLPLNNLLGFHPSMSALADQYKDGRLAIVQGVGYPNPNRSHFRSIDIWQTAQPQTICQTGWLGRFLDYEYAGRQTSRKDFIPAIGIDPISAKSLVGQQVFVPSLSNLSDNCLRLNPLAQKYRSTITYPEHAFARSMKSIAQMIVDDLGTRIYNISLAGFDTHANQIQVHSNLLKLFSDSLAAFQMDLEKHSVDKNVLVLVFSEFGRRLLENEGGGTDHGTAGPVFILGTSVNGGIYGELPCLSDLDQGDLKQQIDFRNVYATILDNWFATDSQQILGGRFDKLAFC